jgi:ABC-type transporter Mla subunit MlaD
MNSEIVFSLKDLGMFVLWGLLVAVLIYILLILVRFYRSFKQIMAIVDENRTNINQVLDEAPSITKNVNQISGEVAHIMESFHGTVENIADTSEEVTGTFKENNELVGQISTVFKILATIKEGIDRVFHKNEND